MTTETVSMEQELESLKSEHQSRTAGLINLVSDPQKMVAEASAIAQLAIKIEALDKKIARANGAPSGEAVKKAQALNDVLALIRSDFASERMAPALTALRTINPSFKTININFNSDGTYDFLGAGGMRKLGGTRVVKVYVGKGLPEEGVRSKGLVTAFAAKYKATKSYDDMDSKERQAFIAKILEGEKGGITVKSPAKAA